MSRRLKHYKEKYVFWIKGGKPRSDLEKMIIEGVDEHCHLAPKYRRKGHKKEDDIKGVDKGIQVSCVGQNYCVTLDIHIKHYSGVLFDFLGFRADLNDKLGLDPGSVTIEGFVPPPLEHPGQTVPEQQPQVQPVQHQQPRPETIEQEVELLKALRDYNPQSVKKKTSVWT